MAMTYRKIYSDIVRGRIEATKGFLKGLNGRFTFPANVPQQGGTATAEMWDTFSTYVPTIGVVPGNQSNNLLVDLTVGSRGTNMVKSGKEKRALEYDAKAMAGAAEKAGDALVKIAQDVVIADFIAAIPGLSITLPTGYIDFAIPSAATDPDVINAVFTSISRLYTRLKLGLGGDPSSIMFFASETAHARLTAALNASWRPSQLNSSASGELNWLQAPIYPIKPPSGFGGASNPTLFGVGGTGYAFQMIDPYQPVEADGGWRYRDDNHWGWDWETEYAYGVADSQLIGEVVNPAT